MIKFIAETAWHHEGDFYFMQDLVERLCNETEVNIIKMHITLDFDEYMSDDHDLYGRLKKWLLTEKQWDLLVNLVHNSDKELMLLLNDDAAIDFAARHAPEYVELHSACLNVPKLQSSILDKIDKNTKIVIGVGGCSLQEVDAAVRVFEGRSTVIMTGFQNFPTQYEDINLNKIRRIRSLYPNKEFGYADHTAWNELNNELITLMVAANGMNYIEKHITTVYGEERCDYAATISFKMMNELVRKIKILDLVNGNGALELNKGERQYSVYGPMKMAAIATDDIKAGTVIENKHFNFIRTSEITDISQIGMVDNVGDKIYSDIGTGEIFKSSHFIRN